MFSNRFHQLRLLEQHGIPVAEWAVARDVNEATMESQRLGYPLAMKVVSPYISHKTDVGGIALDIADEAALRREWAAMQARLQEHAPAAPF